MKSNHSLMRPLAWIIALGAALVVGCTIPPGPVDDGGGGGDGGGAGATGGTVTINIAGIPGDYQDGIAIVIVVEAGSTPEDLETDTVAYGGGGEEGVNISTAGEAGPFALFDIEESAWLSAQGTNYDVYLLVLTGESEIDAAWFFHAGDDETVVALETFVGGSNLTLDIDVSDAVVLNVTDMYGYGNGGIGSGTISFGGDEYALSVAGIFDSTVDVFGTSRWGVEWGSSDWGVYLYLFMAFTGETLPAGEYTFDDLIPETSGTFSGGEIWIGFTTEYGVTGGTVTVSIDGTIYTFTGTLQTTGGEATFSYTGTLDEVILTEL